MKATGDTGVESVLAVEQHPLTFDRAILLYLLIQRKGPAVLFRYLASEVEDLKHIETH